MLPAFPSCITPVFSNAPTRHSKRPSRSTFVLADRFGLPIEIVRIHRSFTGKSCCCRLITRVFTNSLSFQQPRRKRDSTPIRPLSDSGSTGSGSSMLKASQLTDIACSETVPYPEGLHPSLYLQLSSLFIDTRLR